MANIRAVIVYDEPNGQKDLENMLFQEAPEIDLVGTSSTANHAIEIIKKKQPNLLFLDISASDGACFTVLKNTESQDFDVIFVSSHDNYMMQAIQFCAIAYVHKPINSVDLSKAIENAKFRFDKKNNEQPAHYLKENARHTGMHNRIAIQTSESVEFILVSEIIRCEGFEGYTKVIIQDHKIILSSYNLGVFRHLLEAHGFMDIHKSHLINPYHILRYDKEGMVTLSDLSTVPVSRRKRTDFLRQLKRW